MSIAEILRDFALTFIIFFAVIGMASAIAWGAARKMGERDR